MAKEFANLRALFGETDGELFAPLHQRFGHNAAERIEKVFVLGQFLFPLFVIDFEKLVDPFMIDLELGQIEIVQTGEPPDRRFERGIASFAAIDDPFQHAHVVAETGP